MHKNSIERFKNCIAYFIQLHTRQEVIKEESKLFICAHISYNVLPHICQRFSIDISICAHIFKTEIANTMSTRKKNQSSAHRRTLEKAKVVKSERKVQWKMKRLHDTCQSFQLCTAIFHWQLSKQTGCEAKMLFKHELISRMVREQKKKYMSRYFIYEI